MSHRITRRTRAVYGGLLLLWVLIVAWQFVEHRRVRRAARAELVVRAKDISNTLGLVIRSQRRFGGFISKERIESAISSLIKPGELNAIALLNDADEVVASAGEPINLELRSLEPRAELWSGSTVVLMNLVDLGTNLTAEPDPRSATIVLPSRGPPTNRPPVRFDNDREDRDNRDDRRNPDRDQNRPDERDHDPDAEHHDPEGRDHHPDDSAEPGRPPRAGSTADAPTSQVAAGDPDPDGDDDDRGRWRGRRGERRFGRPFWMDEEEYRSLVQRRGVHSFVLVLSTASMQATTRQDLWARACITAFATLAAAGLAFAWRNLARSSDLEVRLARAAELNARLKEMNLAAAGLAHETRNPLNIIRGLAQLISRQPDAPPEVHARSREIIAETDRVTAQLNEFINYSRPREVRWSAVSLGSVLNEVTRALASDVEDRSIQIRVAPDLPVIEGDEALIRQALFNLILNAVQAVNHNGSIEIAAERTGAEFALEIRDDGHGVLPEHRTEIFKPYFTTHAEGTGLGLAVVHQIVMAHGWEIECRPNSPKGAVFRISRLKPATTRT